jgi:hypothetical protein
VQLVVLVALHKKIQKLAVIVIRNGPLFHVFTPVRRHSVMISIFVMLSAHNSAKILAAVSIGPQFQQFA